MADYYTSFSAELPLTQAQWDAARQIVEQWDREELDEVGDEWRGFEIRFEQEGDQPVAWIYSLEGDPDHVILFVQLLAERAPVPGQWGFTWSHTCSKPRVDAFGGGAAVIDLSTGEIWDIDTYDWMTRAKESSMLPGDPFRRSHI